MEVPTPTAMDVIDAKLEEQQLFGARRCPHCGNKFSQKDWTGLPAGVKFDPTDQELIEHLQCKAEGDSNNSHPLIDKFISTIDGEDGICYTHPEKLPGVTKDGLCRHFFHRPSKAYTTGTRKRRKIHVECEVQSGETRWHKTGKTRPVLVNGQQRGCKKILVLYTNFGKNRKPEKTNWVMHQYHLGVNEEEREGELVVSKIFYQTQPRSSGIERASVVSTASAASGEASGGGSGSGDSSKEAAVMAAHYGSSGYAGLDQIHPQLKVDHFGFNPFRKVFDEGGGAAGETSMAAGGSNQIPMVSMSAATCDPNHQDMVTASAFHISRPTHSVSQIMSPHPLHHASIIHNPFQSPGLIVPNHSFQQQQLLQQQQVEEQQQQHNMGGRSSASGLEEIIRSCNPSSSSSADLKQDNVVDQNQQEADWFKYSGFWHDPQNPSHHG